MCSCKVPVIIVRFKWNLNFLRQIMRKFAQREAVYSMRKSRQTWWKLTLALRSSAHAHINEYLTKICTEDKFYREPTRCNNNDLLIIPISSTCFGRWFRSSSGSQDCVYCLWYNAPIAMPGGNLEAMELQFHRFQVTGRHCNGCLIPQAVNTLLVLQRMGEIIARNMLSWLELLINRYCCI